MYKSTVLSGLGLVTDTEEQPMSMFFAPNNTAFQQVPQEVLNRLRASTQASAKEREEVLLYHLVWLGTDATGIEADLGDRVLESGASNAPKLFLRRYRKDNEMRQYVNGAEVLETIRATNGVVHIIDHLLHQVASGNNAYSYIQEQAKERRLELRTSKFMEMLNEIWYLIDSPYNDLNLDTTYVTVFVPSDRALEKVNREQIERLKDNELDLVKLVRRHIISSSLGEMNKGVKAVYHASLLEAMREEEGRRAGKLVHIPALEGVIRPLQVGNELFVTNLCGIAKVLTPTQYDLDEWRPNEATLDGVPVYPNLTVNNGVIHIIDNLLGYIYNDAYEMIKEDEDISAMATFIRKTSGRWANRLKLPIGTILKDNEKVTIFVPTNAAFYNVERADNMEKFRSNVTYIEQVLNMHMVQGLLSLTDMVSGSVLPTTQPGHVIRLTKLEDNSVYVTLGHIRGRIVRADVCVENGILHYIDQVLGVPFTTVYEDIQRTDALLSLYEMVRNVGLDSLLSSLVVPVTLFAPNNTAFSKMEDTEVGRTFLDPRTENQNKFQKLLTAHTVRGYFYAEDMTSDRQRIGTSDLWLLREGDDLYIERRGQFRVVRARVMEADRRMTNGVVFIIDSVLYENSIKAYNAIDISGCAPSGPMGLAVILTILLYNWLLWKSL